MPISDPTASSMEEEEKVGAGQCGAFVLNCLHHYDPFLITIEMVIPVL